MKNNYSKICKKIILIFAVELLLAFCVFAFYMNKKVPSFNFSQQDFYTTDDQENTFKTEMMSLKKGVYTVQADYTSTENNSTSVVLPIDESLARYLKADTTVLRNYDNYAKYRFYLEKDLDVYICNHADEGNTLIVDKMSVNYNRRLSGGYFSLKLLLWMLILDFAILLYYLRKINRIKYEYVILTVIILVCCIPLTVPYIKGGHDVLFHLFRIAGVAESLKCGELPARMQPNWLNGYGAAAGVTYPDLLLYPQALLYGMGIPLYVVYKIYIFEINALTTIGAYICFKKMSDNVNKALIVTAVYSLSMWRMIDLYTRQALGEYTAILFLPFIMLGIYDIYYRQKRISYAFVLGISGVTFSHPLTLLMVVEFVVLFMLIQWKMTFKKDVLLSVLTNGVITILLCMGAIVPVIDYYANEGIGVAATNDNIQGHGIYLSQLFTTGYSAGGSQFNRAWQEMPLTPGVAITFVILVAVMMWATGLVKKHKGLFSSLLSMDLVAILLSTAYFPYGWFMEKLNPIYHLVAAIQFPWRYLTIVTVISTGILLIIINQEDISFMIPKRFQVWICTIVIALSFMHCINYLSKELNDDSYYISYLCDGAMDSFGDVSNFSLAGVNFETMKDKKILVSDDELISVVTIEKRGTSYTLDIANKSDEMEYIELPVMAYRQYKSDDPVVKITRGDNKRIRLHIPGSYEGQLRVRYVEPIIWRISEIISVITFLLLVIYKRKCNSFLSEIDNEATNT